MKSKNWKVKPWSHSDPGYPFIPKHDPLYIRVISYIYTKENHVSYTIYNSSTAEPIWLKVGGEVA